MSAMPLLGFRLWLARSDLVELRSLTEETPWEPNHVMEAHKPPDEGKPWENPGIHAHYWTDIKASAYRIEDSFTCWHVVRRIYATLHQREHHHWVAGAIIGWGRTALHEHGFRAQFAKLTALYYEPTRRDRQRAQSLGDPDGGEVPPRELQAIALRYEVPLCTSMPDLIGCAGEHGRLVRERDLV